ncbi:uridine diphosphate-N-acetylglucosamine-binding protein YvcK [Euzebya sp.]|uniref:gluconeogenesis factor YvcK family protein n=1 Tax=Euzebya sp. TaxID=1971409 RepID=UPI003511BED9
MTDRIVAIGGGHGLARTLEALVHLARRPTAIVTVADDGGSSGRLRQQHGIVALGDMRMALESLAGDRDLADLFEHRFADGELRGHAVGNLALLALVERHDGDVVAAVAAAARLLGCQGAVVPCTTDDVTLVAEVDGAPVEGQVAIQTTPGRHRAVWLEPRDPAACPAAVAAIEAADVVLLGPGSLYTSIVPNLLVPGIRAALERSQARLAYVANLTGQLGETGGMDLQDHVDVLCAHLPTAASLTVVAHRGPAPRGSGAPLGVAVDHPQVAAVIADDLAARREDGTVVAAHDPAQLAKALHQLEA